MKRTRLISTILLTSLLSVSIGGCAGCKGCNVNETTPIITPTTAITATIAPVIDNTNTPVPTKEGIPTDTPIITNEVSPTEEVSPTAVVLPTPQASPIPTATPEPTATPVPSVAPTATPVITVDENATLLGSAKMGDNVWYDLYDDGTLVVRGTGATYDFKDYNDMQLTIRKQTDFLKDESLYNVVKAIIIKEGITEIGTSALDTMGLAEKVVFPTSLKKIGDMALSGVGYFANIEWIGLDVDKVEISKTAFSYCGNAHKITGLSKYTATPTPTPIPPTPTATPLPNPDKPRKVATLAITDTITYEFWDNDVMYVKGSGAIPDQSELFGVDASYYWLDNENPNGYEFVEKVQTVIVEEGITSFGRYCFSGIWTSLREVYLPNTYTTAEAGLRADVIHGYYEGKAVTIKTPSAVEGMRNLSTKYFYKLIEDEAYALEKEATITWE